MRGGIASHTEGQATRAFGRNSHAEGLACMAFGEECHAEGISTKAGGQYCHAEGAGTLVQGTASHVEGQGGGVTSNGTTIPGTSAYGNVCHAEGYGATAAGEACHVEGGYVEYAKSNGSYALVYNQSTGKACHAEGAGTFASSIGAHAEGMADDGNYGGECLGQRVTAIAPGAHAEGIGTYVNAPGAHAEGINTVVYGSGSHAEGKSTVAQAAYQHVVGKYNVADETETYAEIVGGGTSTTARRNIRTLDWNGNETVAGSSIANTVVANTSMTVGGTTFNSTNVIKWNKNSGQDTSDFELAGYILATHTSTGISSAIYYPPNESQVDLGSMTVAELIRQARSRCSRLNIQCQASIALNFANFYSTAMIGKTFEIVFSNSSTSNMTIYLSNNYGTSTANNIRFINGINPSSGNPSGVYDGQIALTLAIGVCREVKFTVLPQFDTNDTTYSFACLWGLLNYMNAGDSNHPVYWHQGIPKQITEQISLTKGDEQCFVATHSTSSKSISLGVGSGGNNRGIYDNTESKWLVYKDTSNVVHLGTATTGSSSVPVYMNAGVPTVCSSLSTSLIANVNQTPATPYNTTAASNEQSAETTYNINFSTGSKWVGTRSTMATSGNGKVGAKLTDGSSVTDYAFLDTLHFSRTGNVGILYGYFAPRPADLYFSKNGTTTKLSIMPKNCTTATFRSITCLNNSVGGCHVMYTGNYLINVVSGGDGVLRFVSDVAFASFTVGARYFFCLPLTYTSFT